MITTASRRALLGAWMVLAALILVLAPLASASEYLRYSSATSNEIDAHAHHGWNQRSSEQERLISYNGYQYSAYWDNDDRLDVSRRDLETNEVQVIEFSEYRLTNTEDPALSVSLGISPNNGRLHIAFDNHISALKIIQSDANFITSPPETIRTSQFRRVSLGLGAFLIATDVHFFNDAADDLYMTYHYGRSVDSGTIQRMAYNSSSSRWIGDETVIDGTTGGCYRGAAVVRCSRGIANANFAFSISDRLWVSWAWVEDFGEFEPGRTTHDLNIAWSRDYGATWHREFGGPPIADVSIEDYIEVRDETVEVEIDEFEGIQDTKMILDPHGRPHIVALQSTTPSSFPYQFNMQVVHHWRSYHGVWFSKVLTDESQVAFGKRSLGTAFFDQGDNFYYVHAVDRLGWYSPEPDYTEIRDFGWRTGGYMAGTKTAEYAELATGFLFGTPYETIAGEILQIRMRNDSDSRVGKLYWATDEDPRFDSAKSVTIPLPRSGNLVYSTVEVSMPTAWRRGTSLRELQLAPVGTATETTGEFSIDFVRFIDYDRGRLPVRMSWEFTEGTVLEAIESPPDYNYETPTAHDLRTGGTQATFDQGFAVDLRRLHDNRYVSIPSVEQHPETGIFEYATREFRLDSAAVVKAWHFSSDEEEWLSDVFAGREYGEGTLIGIVERNAGPGREAEIITTDDLDVPVDPTRNRYITLRMRNDTRSRQGTVYFHTNEDLRWKSKTFAINANSGYTTYTIDMSAVRGWTGTLKGMSLAPVGEARVLPEVLYDFTIDWIKIGA